MSQFSGTDRKSKGVSLGGKDPLLNESISSHDFLRPMIINRFCYCLFMDPLYYPFTFWFANGSHPSKTSPVIKIHFAER